MHRRHFLGHTVATVAAALLCRPTDSRSGEAGEEFDAHVAPTPGRGAHAGSFASVGAAIDAAPRDGTRPFRIFVGAGRWHEKLVVDKPNIYLIGAHRNGTVLTHDTAAGTLRENGEPWGTWGCASVIVCAPGFHARNLTIENAFDYLGHLAAPKLESIGPNGAQAVALMLDAGSDAARFDEVDFIGHQDTLFVDAGTSRFTDCRISGSVDFIFGAGAAHFDQCDIVSRFRPGKQRQGYVCAPSTSRMREQGLVFQRCRLLRERQVPDATVALGRPWRPTREFPDGRYGDPDAIGAALFDGCWMDAHIAPDGWDAMAYTARSGERVMLAPGDARLFERASRGPGAHRSATRRWLVEAGA